jgi:hypothetical protein
MIYGKCAVCGAAVYRYSAVRPGKSETANAGQDCWAVEALRPDDHFPDPKMIAAGHKASRTKGFAAEQAAAYKAVDTRGAKAKGQTEREHNPATFTCSVCFRVRPSAQEGAERVCRDCDAP